MIWMLAVAGVVTLGPGVSKDEESTSKATQVFYVIDCQPKSLEVNIGKK
jgi:hypothetical protein